MTAACFNSVDLQFLLGSMAQVHTIWIRDILFSNVRPCLVPPQTQNILDFGPVFWEMDLNTTLDFFGKDTHSEFWILESRGQNKPKLAHLAHCPLTHRPRPNLSPRLGTGAAAGHGSHRCHSFSPSARELPPPLAHARPLSEPEPYPHTRLPLLAPTRPEPEPYPTVAAAAQEPPPPPLSTRSTGAAAALPPPPLLP